MKRSSNSLFYTFFIFCSLFLFSCGNKKQETQLTAHPVYQSKLNQEYFASCKNIDIVKDKWLSGHFLYHAIRCFNNNTEKNLNSPLLLELVNHLGINGLQALSDILLYNPNPSVYKNEEYPVIKALLTLMERGLYLPAKEEQLKGQFRQEVSSLYFGELDSILSTFNFLPLTRVLGELSSKNLLIPLLKILQLYFEAVPYQTTFSHFHEFLRNKDYKNHFLNFLYSILENKELYQTLQNLLRPEASQVVTKESLERCLKNWLRYSSQDNRFSCSLENSSTTLKKGAQEQTGVDHWNTFLKEIGEEGIDKLSTVVNSYMQRLASYPEEKKAKILKEINHILHNFSYDSHLIEDLLPFIYFFFSSNSLKPEDLKTIRNSINNVVKNTPILNSLTGINKIPLIAKAKQKLIMFVKTGGALSFCQNMALSPLKTSSDLFLFFSKNPVCKVQHKEVSPAYAFLYEHRKELLISTVNENDKLTFLWQKQPVTNLETISANSKKFLSLIFKNLLLNLKKDAFYFYQHSMSTKKLSMKEIQEIEKLFTHIESLSSAKEIKNSIAEFLKSRPHLSSNFISYFIKEHILKVYTKAKMFKEYLAEEHTFTFLMSGITPLGHFSLSYPHFLAHSLKENLTPLNLSNVFFLNEKNSKYLFDIEKSSFNPSTPLIPFLGTSNASSEILSLPSFVKISNQQELLGAWIENSSIFNSSSFGDGKKMLRPNFSYLFEKKEGEYLSNFFEKSKKNIYKSLINNKEVTKRALFDSNILFLSAEILFEKELLNKDETFKFLFPFSALYSNFPTRAIKNISVTSSENLILHRSFFNKNFDTLPELLDKLEENSILGSLEQEIKKTSFDNFKSKNLPEIMTKIFHTLNLFISKPNSTKLNVLAGIKGQKNCQSETGMEEECPLVFDSESKFKDFLLTVEASLYCPFKNNSLLKNLLGTRKKQEFIEKICTESFPVQDILANQLAFKIANFNVERPKKDILFLPHQLSVGDLLEDDFILSSSILSILSDEISFFSPFQLGKKNSLFNTFLYSNITYLNNSSSAITEFLSTISRELNNTKTKTIHEIIYNIFKKINFSILLKDFITGFLKSFSYPSVNTFNNTFHYLLSLEDNKNKDAMLFKSFGKKEWSARITRSTSLLEDSELVNELPFLLESLLSFSQQEFSLITEKFSDFFLKITLNSNTQKILPIANSFLKIKQQDSFWNSLAKIITYQSKSLPYEAENATPFFSSFKTFFSFLVKNIHSFILLNHHHSKENKEILTSILDPFKKTNGQQDKILLNFIKDKNLPSWPSFWSYFIFSPLVQKTITDLSSSLWNKNHLFYCSFLKEQESLTSTNRDFFSFLSKIINSQKIDEKERLLKRAFKLTNDNDEDKHNFWQKNFQLSQKWFFCP